MALIEDLKWRYATKKYNPQKKVSTENVYKIVEAARIAPSSYGIQPFEVYAISNAELKDKIYEVGWKQQIIKDCSHLLVFCAWDSYTKERIDEIFAYTKEERGGLREAFGSATSTIVESQLAMTPEQAFVDTAKQACIAFGTAIAQAAELKVDSTPMGGFENKDLDQLLQLQEKGLKSVYMMALGYREEEGDWLVNLKKVRTPNEKFLTEIN